MKKCLIERNEKAWSKFRYKHSIAGDTQFWFFIDSGNVVETYYKILNILRLSILDHDAYPIVTVGYEQDFNKALVCFLEQKKNKRGAVIYCIDYKPEFIMYPYCIYSASMVYENPIIKTNKIPLLIIKDSEIISEKTLHKQIPLDKELCDKLRKEQEEEYRKKEEMREDWIRRYKELLEYKNTNR